MAYHPHINRLSFEVYVFIGGLVIAILVYADETIVVSFFHRFSAAANPTPQQPVCRYIAKRIIHWLNNVVDVSVNQSVQPVLLRIIST